MKSKYKLPYFSSFLWKRLWHNTLLNLNFYTTQKSIYIHPLFFFVKFFVYNGQVSYPIFLEKNMSSHKLGEFIYTRKSCVFKSKKRKKMNSRIKNLKKRSL